MVKMAKISLAFIILIFSIKVYGMSNVFDGKTAIKDPFKMRDPFANPVMSSRQSRVEREKEKTNYNNLPNATNLNVSDMMIVGILTGKDRSAIVRRVDDDKTFYTVKEGMKIGRDKIEVKAILPGGMILVEKITNIYGDDEYIETVIPISK